MRPASRAGFTVPRLLGSTETVPASSSSATPGPRSSLMTASIRAAVVKSASRSARRKPVIVEKSKLTSRSTRAPDGTAPAVGTPCTTFAASPSTATPPAITEPCATA